MVDLAVGLADERPGALRDLTLSSVADRAGVAVPSLYKHVGSLAELRDAVALVGVRELSRRTAAAAVGRSGPDALRALCLEVRRFAHEHPGLYAGAQDASDADDETVSARADAVGVVVAVLRGFDLPSRAEVDAVRAVRATVHGFVDLEVRNGFGLPDDTDRSFDVLIDLLVDGIRALAVGSPRGD